jgi:hypothetical protein
MEQALRGMRRRLLAVGLKALAWDVPDACGCARLPQNAVSYLDYTSIRSCAPKLSSASFRLSLTLVLAQLESGGIGFLRSIERKAGSASGA